MNTLRLKNRYIKEFSQICQLFKGDGTRSHINKAINITFIEGGITYTATDGHVLVKKTILDPELKEALQEFNPDKPSNVSMIFEKFTCTVKEEVQYTELLRGYGVISCLSDFPRYESIIPKGKPEGASSIGLTPHIAELAFKVLKTLRIKTPVKWEIFNDKSPIKITHKELDGLILLMPTIIKD